MGVVLIINYNTMNLVERFGWNGMAFAFGVIAVVLLLITFFFTKERSIAGISGKSEKKIPVGQSFRLLFKNKYFIFVTLIFVINYTALRCQQRSACIFYARDVLGNAGLMGTLTLCFILPKMIGNLLYPQITRIMGKWKSLALGSHPEMAGVAVMALTPSSLGTAVAGLVLLGIEASPIRRACLPW
ncbi:MAG: MFS transporter [Enterocloster clostridioformis]